MEISVIGAGKWGSALFSAFSQKNDCIRSSRTMRDLPKFVSLEEAFKREYLVFSIATQGVRAFLEKNFKFEGQKILVTSKGIETSTGKFLHEIFEDFVPKENLAFLSGPSFASEVSKKLPCALVVNSVNQELAATWAEAFPSYIKSYTSSDVIGSEICGAYKNVIAIAGGICEGLELGNNARASLIARGLVEMNRFGSYFGADDETFFGLSGAGDLFLTASSTLSRNFRVGLGLAKGKNLAEILNDLGEVAEGVPTAKAIKLIAQEKNIYTPIADEICAILNGKDAKESLVRLLQKSGK